MFDTAPVWTYVTFTPRSRPPISAVPPVNNSVPGAVAETDTLSKSSPSATATSFVPSESTIVASL